LEVSGGRYVARVKEFPEEVQTIYVGKSKRLMEITTKGGSYCPKKPKSNLLVWMF
jgi:hypothetical protein